MPQHYHNMVYCPFCGAEYNAGYPAGPLAPDSFHDCDPIPLEIRLEEQDYQTYIERDEIVAHLNVIRAAMRSAAAATLGSMTSDKKATAARENGKLGGRPRKTAE